MNPDENELIEAFTTLIRLPLPQLKTSLFHKAKELEHLYADELKEYRKIKRMIDPGKSEKKEKTGGPVKDVNFEIKKIKGHWTVSPVGIPREIVNHIISHNLNPGIIKMQKFKLQGKMVGLSFEKQSRGCYTGSITEKGSEKETKKETPSKQAKKADKTGDLEILLYYLLNNEFLFNVINDVFLEKWKPLIDQGIINKKKVIED